MHFYLTAFWPHSHFQPIFSSIDAKASMSDESDRSSFAFLVCLPVVRRTTRGRSSRPSAAGVSHDVGFGLPRVYQEVLDSRRLFDLPKIDWQSALPGRLDDKSMRARSSTGDVLALGLLAVEVPRHDDLHAGPLSLRTLWHHVTCCRILYCQGWSQWC